MAGPSDPEEPAVDRQPESADPPWSDWPKGDPHEPDLGSQPRPSLGPLSIFGFGVDRRRQPQTPLVIPSLLGNLLAAAAVVIVIWALKEARPVLVPLVVSAFGATLTAPLVFWLKKRRVPAGLAVPVVVVATLTVVALVAGLVVGSLNAFIRAAPTYQANLDALVLRMSNFAARFGISIDTSKLLEAVQPSSLIGLAAQLVSQLADLFSSAVLIFLITVLFLFEVLALPDKIRKALGDPSADLSQGLAMVGRVQAYVVVKTYTSLATGTIVGVLLYLQGIDFALLWGLLAFLLDFVPSIGSIVAAVPAVLLALVQQGVTGALLAGGWFLLANMVIGNFVEPRVMGRRMNLSPLVVFTSLVFWGWLWGPLGMILSVPLTMVLRILLEGNPSTRPMAILMAAEDARPVIDLSRMSSLPLSRRSTFPQAAQPHPAPPGAQAAHPSAQAQPKAQAGQPSTAEVGRPSKQPPHAPSVPPLPPSGPPSTPRS